MTIDKDYRSLTVTDGERRYTIPAVQSVAIFSGGGEVFNGPGLFHLVVLHGRVIVDNIRDSGNGAHYRGQPVFYWVRVVA